MECNDAGGSEVVKRPGYSCNQVCSHNFAQMGLNFFEFDAVTEYFDLVVNSPEVVKRARGILVSQISRAIPSGSFQRWKTGLGQVGILKVSSCDLSTGHHQLPLFARRQKNERFASAMPARMPGNGLPMASEPRFLVTLGGSSRRCARQSTVTWVGP